MVLLDGTDPLRAFVRLGVVVERLLDNVRLGVEDATALLNDFVRDLLVEYDMVSGAGKARVWR